MKQITSFQTADGKLFADKSSAAIHEASLNLYARITAEYEPLFKAAPDSRRLMDAMTAEPQFFIEALTAYAKVLRKNQPTTTETIEETSVLKAA